MPHRELISVVIPCYNPTAHIQETLASVQQQTYPEWEAIIVDDGSDSLDAISLIRDIEQRQMPQVRVLHSGRIGLPKARNTGIREARGRYVIPLDSDDQLEPEMMQVCLSEMEAHPEAGFAYFDYQVFGEKNYIEYPGPYNLYRLLEENFMAHCIFLRREAWEDTGGYDEWHLWAYEDWHFFLQLGERGWYGHYIPKVLFRYRTHYPGHHYVGLANHEKNWKHIVESRPQLFSPEGRLNVKRQWAPAVCFVVSGGRVPAFENQTVRDFQILVNVDEKTALRESNASCFLWKADANPLRPHAAEECIWALQEADWATWTDTGEAPPPSLRNVAGPLGIRRETLAREEEKRSGAVRRIPWPCREEANSSRTLNRGGNWRQDPVSRNVSIAGPTQHSALSPAKISREPTRTRFRSARAVDRILHHLQNAELLSLSTWLEHPFRSAGRLIPLRWKEKVNQLARRPVFDLSFYLKFQPRSVLIEGGLVKRLDYIPPDPCDGKKRIALLTPHLGHGGAENVLLEFARQIDRRQFEVFLIATQSDDSRLRREWEEVADHVYDALALVSMEQVRRFIYSLAVNWSFDVLVVQNTLPAYSVLPALKEKRPGIFVVDILHNVHDDWDFFSATLEVAEQIDQRVVISEAGRQRLIDMAISEEKIRLIRNGVDLKRFDPTRYRRGELHDRLGLPRDTNILLFAGALVERKRPLLLPKIAAELARLRPQHDFHFVVAGDGPEEERLRSLIPRKGLAEQFSVLGHVDEIAELLADSELLLILSTEEGIPLALVESLAMQTPVVSCRAGAIEEALASNCGVLVESGSGEEVRFARAIHDLLEDSARRREMGRAGRELAEREYSLDRAQRQYRELLSELSRKNQDLSL